MKAAIRNIAIALFIAFIIGGVFYLSIDQYTTNATFWRYFFFWLLIASCFAIPSLLWDKVLDHCFPWSDSGKRIWITIVTHLILLTFLSVIISFLQVKGLENPTITFEEYINGRSGRFKIAFYLLIAVCFSFFFHAKGFYGALKESKEREIKLIEEKKETELNALKSQIDPHFLFNNLNVLNALIDENPKRAQEFVGELSKVYRYVLEVKDKEIVSLEEEINFAKRYFNLLEKRFEKAIQLKIVVSNLDKKIVPLTLQTALENAIKHNHFTEYNPLAISIFEEENNVVIENNYQKKEVLHSNKSGLKNLAKRYELLNEKLEIEQTSKTFKLKIPLI